MNNEPITLGKIKKGGKTKPILIIIIFLFMGSFILFLPTIINYFGDYNLIDLIKNGELIDFFKNHNSYINKQDDTIKNNTILENTSINTKTVLESNNITLNNFEITKTNIKFKINNEQNIDLDNNYYYLILKKDTTTIYIRIENKNELNFTFTTPLKDTLNISGNIKKYNDNDYPKFTLSSDETGLSSLICTKSLNNYEYIFDNNLLVRIKLNYTYNDTGNNSIYLSEFEKYTALQKQITLNGNTSNITENQTGFTFTADVNLNNQTNLVFDNYYKFNTKSNKVNFDMIAKGYDCK